MKFRELQYFASPGNWFDLWCLFLMSFFVIFMLWFFRDFFEWVYYFIFADEVKKIKKKLKKFIKRLDKY